MLNIDDLKERLNPSQLAAVTLINGPVLVIAGAGSGKTRAIEYRVMHLVQSGVDPASILLLTFTRRAAEEMVSRASGHDPRCKNVDGGTFHAFAFRMLKRYASALGISSLFSILDEGDSVEAVGRAAAKIGFFDREEKTPKKDTLRTIISMSINKALSIERILEKEYPHFTQFAAEINTIRKEYAAYKINKNYLDYDDLLVYLRLLLGKEEIRKRISEKYKYVMVDEYQDTNSLQGDIAYLLAKDHNNIMIVGDDAQSIYGFRGSSHKNIMDFPNKFAGCTIIKLEANYRSIQPILDVANSILENMGHKYSKCLTSTRGDDGDRPRLNYFKNVYDEAAWITARVKELRAEDVGLAEQAVLFRSAYVSIPLQAELSKNGIPYQVFGGLKFYETAHVKDMLAHMKIVLNHRDEIAWHRALTLIDGIGPKSAERIAEGAIARESLTAVVEGGLAEDAKVRKSTSGLGRLRTFLRAATSFDISPGALYDLAFDYYQPLLKLKFDDWHLRINDLEALRQIAARYTKLDELLADFAIEPPDRGVMKVLPKMRDEDIPLTLSTIHSAKGLEWDTVYLIGLTDGVLPSSFALNDVEQIEEESRLFYVAVTRARNRLYCSLSHEASRGGISQFNKVSRFLDAPNIISKLDQSVVLDRDIDDVIDLDDDDGIIRTGDRRSLVKDVLDFYT